MSQKNMQEEKKLMQSQLQNIDSENKIDIPGLHNQALCHEAQKHSVSKWHPSCYTTSTKLAGSAHVP
jgi:hypothetical protein